jgi:ribosome-associated protein
MVKRVSKDDTSKIVKQIVSAMQEKKAQQIVSIDLTKITSAVTKFFIICHAPSKTQVDAIYKNVVETVKENCDAKPFYREGYENSEWILIDYFDVVAHIFLEDIRSFYQLEDLWADGKKKVYKIEE